MIYILSKFPRSHTGHYWSFDGYVRRALRENQLDYRFLNPSAKSALEEDHQFGETHNEYVPIIDNGNFIQTAIDYVLSDIRTYSLKRITILIPWLPQFTIDEIQKLDIIEENVVTKFVGLSVLSPQQVQEVGNQNTRYLFEEYFLSKNDCILWVSDVVPSNYRKYPFIRELPDYAEVNLNEEEQIIWDISFFGLLTPYRGIFEILLIGLFNPKIRIRIKGPGFAKHRIIRPWKYKFLRYKNWRANPVASVLFSTISILSSALLLLRNIDFSDEPFETEEDLDRGMSQTRFIFYCPKLPHGSGLTNKSLAAGIPVLWHGWQGKAFSILKQNYPQGYIPYIKFFTPNYISRKIDTLEKPQKLQTKLWKKFSAEVSSIR